MTTQAYFPVTLLQLYSKVDGTKIEETATLESSVSKIFCICVMSLSNKGQVILGPCIKWIPHHKCFWQKNKQTNQRSTEQHNSRVPNQACPFIVPAFTVSTSSWLTAKPADCLTGLAIWPILHFLCPHWGSAWGFYQAVFLFHSGRNACFWLDCLAVKAWSRPARY